MTHFILRSGYNAEWTRVKYFKLLKFFFIFTRKKRKILRERRRQRERVELKMDLPGVSVADDGDTGMFSLRTVGKNQVIEKI